jgi:hypothetical protein
MNEIKNISKDDFYDLVNKNDNNYYVVVIDGKENQDWDSYKKSIEKLFKFHSPIMNVDSYVDWMQDLMWLNADGFILGIINYDKFLSKDLWYKEAIMESFRDEILTWWEEDVEKYCVGGKKKYFGVFIIE